MRLCLFPHSFSVFFRIFPYFPFLLRSSIFTPLFCPRIIPSFLHRSSVPVLHTGNILTEASKDACPTNFRIIHERHPITSTNRMLALYCPMPQEQHQINPHRPQSLTSPLKTLSPCGSAGMITFKHSAAPLGLPGRLIIRHCFLIPATALDSMA